MTKSEERIILEMYKADAPLKAIAAAVHKSEGAVKHWVSSNREKHQLERRRVQAETTGVNTPAAESASSWNITEGVELLKQKWGAK